MLATPVARYVPNGSFERNAMRIARHSSTAYRSRTNEAPTKPNSSPATVKMKSVCCSARSRASSGVRAGTPGRRGRRCRRRSPPGRGCTGRRPACSRGRNARSRSSWYSFTTPSWNAAAITRCRSRRGPRCGGRSPRRPGTSRPRSRPSRSRCRCRLDEHEDERHERHRTQPDHVLDGRRRVPELGQARGEHHDQADLRELRRRDLEARDLEPSLRAGLRRAEERQPHEQQGDDRPRR